jgi:hypothetical protein
MQELQKKLWELTEESTRIINTNPDCYKLYWRHGDYKFTNIHLAIWYEKETGHFCEYHHVKIDDIRLALEDKSLDMDHNYNLDFLKHIRNKYDHITLLLSGGWDSHTVFMEAMDGDIFIDHLLTWVWFDKYHPCNIEVINNVYPLLDLYKNKYGKYTTLCSDMSTDTKYWEDEWWLFKSSNSHAQPIHMAQIHRTSLDTIRLGIFGENPPWWNVPNNCTIKSDDKPHMLLYNDKWYVIALDTHSASDGSIQDCLLFWWEPENIKSLIKDARIYREYILNNHERRNRFGKLEFFKLTNPGNELNQYINRRPIIDSNAQYAKMDKHNDRIQVICENKNITLMNNYFQNINNFLKVFPGSERDNFHQYNQNRKWAWCIDIDTLEVYSQTELIPDGFDI